MMDIQVACHLINTLLFNHSGKPLSDLQQAIIQGTWSRETYQVISQSAYCTEGHVKDVAADLWQQLSSALGVRVSKKNLYSVLVQHQQQQANSTPMPKASQRQNWGDAPDSSTFLGRQEELATLEQWIIEQNCRLVLLLGMGGMGKTTLCAKFAQECAEQFDFVFWRSLSNAPPMSDILSEMVPFLSQQQETTLPEGLDRKILRLLAYLRTHRCLLVLDNAESVIGNGDRLGGEQSVHRGYHQLLKQIGLCSHRSCLIVTSREKPQEFGILAGDTLPIRALTLKGLPSAIGQAVMQTKGTLGGTSSEWRRLVAYYGGNPLALKIVAAAVKDCFGGNLTDFLPYLQQDAFIFEDIRQLLNDQWLRLTKSEQAMMYCLAINREPMTFAQLQLNEILLESPLAFSRALMALQGRSMIEAKPTGFSQQPVVMEYVIEQLIQQIAREISSGELRDFKTHALVRVNAKEYIQDIQIRLILQPIIEQLLRIFGSIPAIEKHVINLLEPLRGKPSQDTGYAGGNLFNLLRQLSVDFRGYDFSDLVIWQANFQDINLHQVNLAHTDLKGSVFSEVLDSILSVAMSPNGQFLATGDVQGQIRLWQFSSSKFILTLQGHPNMVRSLAFSPDSQLLASGSYDQTIKFWDVSHGNCLATYVGHEHGVAAVTFSPDGRYLASCSYDQTIKLWSLHHPDCLQTLAGHTDWVNTVAFSPNGRWLVSGSSDQTLRLWDMETRNCRRTYTGHHHGISSVAFSPTESIFASGSADGTLKLWSTRHGSCLGTCTGHTDWVHAITFRGDGQLLASGSADQTVKFWRVDQTRCIHTGTGHRDGIWSLMFHPKDPILASGSFDQTVRLWDSNTGHCLKTLSGYNNWSRSVVFSPDAHTLISGNTDHRVRVWDIRKGSCIRISTGHQAQVATVGYSHDGNHIASGSFDHTIRLWDAHTGQSQNTLTGHQSWVCSLAFSPDDQSLLSGSFDHTLKLWSTQQGECLQTYVGHDNVVWSVVFSPDGKTIASASADHTVKLWDIKAGQCRLTCQGHHNVVWSVAFSRDGQVLASGGADKVIRRWHMSDGSCQNTYLGHTNWILAIAFSPNNQILASASADNTVKLWDVGSGECLQTLKEHTKAVYSVAFSADGQYLASASQDETIKLWDIAQVLQTNLHTCHKTLVAQRLYEGLNITGVAGLTAAEQATLSSLGAIQTSENAAHKYQPPDPLRGDKKVKKRTI